MNISYEYNAYSIIANNELCRFSKNHSKTAFITSYETLINNLTYYDADK